MSAKNTAGAKTAYSGHLSEEIINEFLNIYIDCCHQNLPSSESLSIAANLEFFSSFDLEKKDVLGEEEYNQIVHDSFQAGNKVVDYVLSEYEDVLLESHHTGIGGPEYIKSITGRESNADILLRLRSKYLGVSLKYSKTSRNKPIKLFSPTIASFVSFFDTELNYTSLRQEVEEIASQGLEAQILALKPFDKYLRELELPSHYHGVPCSYVDEKLSRGAISWIRDNKTDNNKEVYRAISGENRKMNCQLALKFSEALTKLAPLKDKILSYITNTGRADSLDTFCVYTKRKLGVHVYDVEKIIQQYLERDDFPIGQPINKTTFNYGPGRIYVDCRPTCHRPAFQYTINYYLKV